MLRLMVVFMALVCAIGIAAQENRAPGANVYAAHCGSCHDSGAPRTPSRTNLQERTRLAITKALESGVMKTQGSLLTPRERMAVAGWLGRKTAAGVSPGGLLNPCKSPAAAVTAGELPAWRSWGGDLANSRFQPASAANLSVGEAPRLKLKWAFAIPDATAVRSQPAVYAGRVILGGEGAVYSLDAATGCMHWAVETPNPVRSGISIGSPDDTPLAFYGDGAGNVYAINVVTGSPVWQMRADAHPTAIVTGTPVYYRKLLFVPVASSEEVIIGTPDYVCCTFRGSVLALDARTGKSVWQTYTIDELPQGRLSRGGDTKTKGPSGAGVWSSPTIDVEKDIVYVTTGDNYSDPPSGTSDAVLALSIDTGKLLWAKQLRSGDAFNVGCTVPDKKGCPDASGPDYDLGAPSILSKLPNGRRVLILSQKSGEVFGVDPDQQGKLLWRSQVGKGGVLGGIEWGAASDGERLYVAVSDQGFLPPAKAGDPISVNPEAGGGLSALRLDNGERIWMTSPAPCGTRRPCSPGQPGAVTVIPGAVFSGSLDGHIRGYSTNTGKVFWDYDTVRDYTTVNGIPGHGGSLNVAGPVIAGGMLYVTSGYSTFGAIPGNMFLAFTVDGR